MAKTPDTLTGMARLLTTLRDQLGTPQLEALATRTGMSTSEVRTLFNRANTITNTSETHEITRSTLERVLNEPDMYTLEGDHATWIAVEDPNRPGRGFDIRIRDTGDGPTISIWMMNDADIPGADTGFVPLDPIARHEYRYDQHLLNQKEAAE